MQPLTNVFLKIFARGFYTAHAGLLTVGFFVMFGMVEPGQIVNYHKTLMLTMVSSPLMMAVVFAAWFIYTVKCWHYVNGQIGGINQQFLFYSSNAFDRKQQFKSWFYMQSVLSLPISVYGFIAAGVGMAHHFYVLSFALLLYLTLLAAISARLYMRTINKLIDGGAQSWFFTFISKWSKPWFSLFIYNVFDKHKIAWLVTKGISYLLITGFFLLFADVAHDVRVAGIAILSVAVAHVRLIFENRAFEEKWLSFTRNLPYSRAQLFINFIQVYLVLLLPEVIWLFSRFNPVIAVELLLAGIGTLMLFHCLLYYTGLDMEKYMLWIFFLFVMIFWMILFRLLWVTAVVNLAVAFAIFYGRYYKPKVLMGTD